MPHSLLAVRNGGDIDVIGIHGDTLLKVYTDQASGAPRFSPSGDYIVFAANIGHWPDGSSRFDIFVIDKEGQDLTQIGHGTQPCWSPDGTEIVYLSGSDLWIMAADGTNQRQITFGGGASQPSWYN